jgi:DNA-binding NtrC family response regulator
MITVATTYSDSFPGNPQGVSCQLVVVEGPDAGRAVRLGKTEVRAGTAPECELVLTDERVSRLHLGVLDIGGRYRARDLGSTNGTLYEGSLVGEVEVGPGATFKLGRTFLRVVPAAQPLEVAPSQSRRFGELVAESLAMREVFAVMELCAGSDVTVLLEGETGTGKELAARALHAASARRQGPFVAVDCGALPESLLESELFGHVRGAFTGASQSRAGAFRRAHGGTLFLDELGRISAPVQARLLRVIEERKVRPLGSDAEQPVDLRLVAATRDDLAKGVAEGTFRPDLFYRVSVVRVVLPPLRQRREDIGPVVGELMRLRGLSAGTLAGSNLDRLMAHDWPGNVRELRNVVDRALALSPGATRFADLRLAVPSGPGGAGGAGGDDDGMAVRADLPFAEAKALVLHRFEARYLRDLLARCQGNVSLAARTAGVDRKHLRTLLRRHGLLTGDDPAGPVDPGEPAEPPDDPDGSPPR